MGVLKDSCVRQLSRPWSRKFGTSRDRPTIPKLCSSSTSTYKSSTLLN